MGCRPSKHATSKIRDAHSRGINQCTCMYSPRKYNKKHKCNSNGTGSKRTSGGTQNGSHGNGSTGHRSRSYKSDDGDFPAFSTTSAVYRRGTSKASKITLRLSSDGSTLEIEQCDYSIANPAPPVRTTSRPWSSTPNLVKMGNRGSPMFRDMDLHLRPSASVWTNTSATRSTPGAGQPSISWQAALLREKREKQERQISMNEITTETLDIRETMLLNDDDGTEDIKEIFIDEEPMHDFNKFRPVIPVHGQDISKSNRSYRLMSHRQTMSTDMGGKFDPPRRQIAHESSANDLSSGASPNHNLNLYCLSQFSESSLNNLEMRPRRQHRDKCTASLRNPEHSARSKFSSNIHFRKAQSFDVGGQQDTNFDRFEAKKQNQRYSIPRYDCFKIADYDDFDDQASILGTSNQQDILLEHGEGYNWVDGRQQYANPRRRSYHASWTEKLTDRQKLVLNLSTNQPTADSSSATFTPLVGKRDENWHSNDHLIPSKNPDQPFVSILNSPVESDAVLTFIELGCPVSHPEKRFDTELGSPRRFYSPAMHTPSCNNQRDGGIDDVRQDKLLAEISDRFINQNISDLCMGRYSSRQSFMKDESSSNVVVRKDHEKAIITCARLENDPLHSPQKTIAAKSENRIRNKNGESDNDAKDHKDKGNDFDPCWMKSMREYKGTEARTSLLQSDRQMLDVNIEHNSNAFPLTPFLHFHPDGPKQRNRKGKSGGENGFGWSGIAAEERRAGPREAHSKNIDENGNCNANKQSRPDGNETSQDRMGRDGVCNAKTDKEGTDMEDLLKIVETQNNVRDGEDRETHSGGNIFKSSYFGEDSDQDLIVYDSLNGQTNSRNQNLPLLCYNNSFGERIQGLSLKSENKPCQPNTPGTNHNGRLPALDHDSQIEGSTSEAFSLCPDKIDGTFHQAMQPPMMESMGVSPCVTESIPQFQTPTVLGGKDAEQLNSGKYAAAVDVINSVSAQRCSASQDKQSKLSPTSLITKEKICHKNDSISSRIDSLKLTKHREQIKESPIFTSGYHQIDCDQDDSNILTKIAWHSNQNCSYFHHLLPSLKNTPPFVRSTVPLRILQARIIGRNISDFANICFYSDHKDFQSFQSETCMISTHFNYEISSRQAEDDINETWAALKNSHICNSNDAVPITSCVGMNALTKSQLHSKYALTQAKLTEDIKQTSHCVGPNQIDHVDKKNLFSGPTLSTSQIPDLACLPDVNLSSNEGDFPPKINFSSSSSNTACLPDVESSHIFPLPQAFTSSSSAHSSAGEFTSQEDDSTARPPCKSHHAAVCQSTASSKEEHSLINSQLSSSHSSDSLSCTLSTYSLANTLHSDTSNSDSCHNGIICSDNPLSDSVRYDSPHSDSSHSNTIELTSQLHDSQGSIIQCLVSVHETQTLSTPPSSSVRSNTPSSYISSQSTHSPRSSPLSTISPHSSPCSQCTLSPHSSSSSSPSHQTFQDARECLPDDQSHFYSTPPESASFSHNPTFFFPALSNSSSPSPLKAHVAEDFQLSILTPSISCRNPSTQNPESHKRQGSIDLDDKSGLNLNEIQSSLGKTSGNCGKDRSVKWDKPSSERTSQEFQINPLPRLHRQNGDGDNNRSTLSDRDSTSSKYSEREGETARVEDAHETEIRLCAIMGTNEIGAVKLKQSRGEEGSVRDQNEKGVYACHVNEESEERNIYSNDQCVQYSYDYGDDLIHSTSQSHSASLENSNQDSFNILNHEDTPVTTEVQADVSHLHVYASCQDIEFSTMDGYDDQSFEALSVYQCTPMFVQGHHLNEYLHGHEFRNVSQDNDTGEVWDRKQLVSHTREDDSRNKYVNIGDEFIDDTLHLDRETETEKCRILSGENCMDFLTNKTEKRNQETVAYLNLEDCTEEKIVRLDSGENKKAVFSDNSDTGHKTRNVIDHKDLSSAENETALEEDTYFANIPCNTDGSQIELNQNGNIDSLSLPKTANPIPEEIPTNKTERPKRKVQSLVQHFESVSLGSQAETPHFE